MWIIITIKFCDIGTIMKNKFLHQRGGSVIKSSKRYFCLKMALETRTKKSWPFRGHWLRKKKHSCCFKIGIHMLPFLKNQENILKQLRISRKRWTKKCHYVRLVKICKKSERQLFWFSIYPLVQKIKKQKSRKVKT